MDETAVAITGIVATGAVGLGAAVIQAVTAWRHRLADRRRARYSELVDVYSAAGLVMFSAYDHLTASFEYLSDPDREEPRLRYDDFDWALLQHHYSLLVLHRASAEAVMAAERALKEGTRCAGKIVDRSISEADLDHLHTLVMEFYNQAGVHLRSVGRLPSDSVTFDMGVDPSTF